MLQAKAGNSMGAGPSRLKMLGNGYVFRLVALVCIGVALPMLAGTKNSKPLTTPDGHPIRKVFIRTASAHTGSTVAADLARNTCLTAVSNENQADAVLDVGVALPGLGAMPPTPSVFTPSVNGQRLSNPKNKPERTVTASCTSGSNGGCIGSNGMQADDLGTDLPPNFVATGSRIDVSLIALGKGSQKIWAPREKSKRGWADQLRKAAGCPVCPGHRFNRRHYKNYSDWVQAKCPDVLASGSR